jgi:hypothetical protein
MFAQDLLFQVLVFLITGILQIPLDIVRRIIFGEV